MIKEKIHKTKRKITKFFQKKISVDYEQTCILPDKMYIKRKYKKRMGKEVNLKKPVTYSEKIQWLKLYDRRPEYTIMADKYLAKDYVANIIGKEYIIPTLGVWERVEDIDFGSLPNQFVLKTTHDSGGVVICKDKQSFDEYNAKETLKKSLQCNYYLHSREWVYKNIKPRVIAEVFLEDRIKNDLIDYKFYCFDGVAKAMYIAQGRPNNTRFDYFDIDCNHLPLKYGYDNSEYPIEKPAEYERMIEIAEALSKGIPHVRVDLFDVEGHIYFGEMTFADGSGMTPFEPDEWDKTFGDWIKLPKKRRR